VTSGLLRTLAESIMMMMMMVIRDVTKFEFEFNDIGTSNVFTRFEI